MNEKKYVEVNDLLQHLQDEPYKGAIRRVLLQAPAADVVEVVRKPVKDYEGYYEVDQFGRVFGLDRTIIVVDGERTYEKLLTGRQMKQSIHDKGYKTLSLTKDGKTKSVFVHRIVAEAFIPNPGSKTSRENAYGRT